MNLLWLLGLLILAYIIRHWYVCPGRWRKKKRQISDISCVVFDLHGVVLQRNHRAILRHIIKHAVQPQLILLCFTPSFVKDVIRLLQKSRVPEEFIIELSQKHRRLAPFVESIIAMLNEQHIIPSTLKILKQLKATGYQLYLFSNIGEKTFERLSQKFPELFAYFDGIGVVQQQDNWVQKPYTQAFKKFLTRFGLNARECVFVDNSYKNSKVAMQEGFYPILYRSPRQLLCELKELKIL